MPHIQHDLTGAASPPRRAGVCWSIMVCSPTCTGPALPRRAGSPSLGC